MCFTRHDDTTVIVTGLFHERMNIPVRLKELQTMSARDIAVLHAEIGQEAVRRRGNS